MVIELLGLAFVCYCLRFVNLEFPFISILHKLHPLLLDYSLPTQVLILSHLSSPPSPTEVENQNHLPSLSSRLLHHVLLSLSFKQILKKKKIHRKE